MKCPNCGAELTDDTIFCYQCGMKVYQEEGDETEIGSGFMNQEMPFPGEAAPGTQSSGEATEAYGTGQSEMPTSGGAMPASVPAPRPAGKPKKSKKKLFIVIAAVLAGVALIAAIVAYMIWNSPKNVVLRSVAGTVRAISDEKTGLNGYLGLDEIWDMTKTGKTRQTLSVGVSLDDLGVDGLSGDVGLDLALDRNADKEAYGSISLNVVDMHEPIAEFYGDKSQWLMTIPVLYDGSFFVDRAQFKEMVESGELFDMLEEDYDLDLDEETKDVFRKLAGVGTKGGEERYIFDDLVKEYVEFSSETWATLVKDIEVKKTDKKSFKIGEEDTSCRGYVIRIPEKDLRALNDNFGDFLIEKAVPMMEMVDSVYGGYENYEGDVEDMIDEIDDVIDGDFEVRTYVGPGTRLVGLEWDGEISDRGDDFDVDVAFHLLGAINPTDRLALSMKVSQGRESVEYDFTRKLKEDDSTINDVLELYREDDTGDIGDVRIFCESELDKDSGDWTISLGGEYDRDEASVTLGGAFDNVKKGKGYTLIVDSLDADIEGVEIPDVDFNVTYGISQIDSVESGDITSRDKMNVLEADESDWEDMTEEMKKNLVDFLYDLGDGFGISKEQMTWMLMGLW